MAVARLPRPEDDVDESQGERSTVTLPRLPEPVADSRRRPLSGSQAPGEPGAALRGRGSRGQADRRASLSRSNAGPGAALQAVRP